MTDERRFIHQLYRLYSMHNGLSYSKTSNNTLLPQFLLKYKNNDQIITTKSTTSSSKTIESKPIESTKPNNTDEPPKEIQPHEPKKSLLKKVIDEIKHYYHGFRLLGLEFKIASGICLQVLTGKQLTRRERDQLVRTAADIFRLIPFAVFIIVPFMELLLPVYLKFFPFMLPSTFKQKHAEEKKLQQILKAKLEMARFLQETVMHTTGATAKDPDAPTIEEFHAFMKMVRQSGQLAKTADIVRFSRVFEDQVTLDSLEHSQLKALCQLLEITSIGPSNLLRFQLWLRVRQLRAQDHLIAKEGIDQIPSWELQSLSRDRGMRSLGLTEQRLRSQLTQWLELHLEKNIPISLLLLSRAMYVQDTTLPPEEQLQRVISRLPPAASQEAAVKVLEAASLEVDPKLKMEVLREAQQSIKADRVAEKQRLTEEKKRRQVEDTEKKATTDEKKRLAEETLVDRAEELKPAPEEEIKTPTLKSADDHVEPRLAPIFPAAAAAAADVMIKPDLSTKAATPEGDVISSEDLDELASAIVNMDGSSKAMQEEHLQDLKTEVAEATKRRQQQVVEALTEVPPTMLDPDAKPRPSEKSKAVKATERLGKQLDKLLIDMALLTEKLGHEKSVLLQDIQIKESKVEQETLCEEKEKIFEKIREDQQRLVDINDLFLSLQRMQKVPDDARWQRILEVLDEDHDGKIELKHVVAVIKLLGSENLKLNTKQMTTVMEMLEHEELKKELDEAPVVKISTPLSSSDSESSLTSKRNQESDSKLPKTPDAPLFKPKSF